MTNKTNVYKVEAAGKVFLVRAANRAQALRHIAKASIKVELATQDDLIELLPTTPIQTAGASDDEGEEEGASGE